MSWISSLIALPFQKICGNYRGAIIIISPTSDVHYNVCCLKQKVDKLGFLCASIVISNELVLLTIKSKWVEVIEHMLEFTFLNLPYPK